MNTGIDYLLSDEKRAFDRRIAHLLQPAIRLARLGASATFGYEMYTDTRVGQASHKFEVHKIKTLDDNGEPLSYAAELFRRLGLDETPQISDIATGQLSLVGRRQLVPEEYECMRDLANRTNSGRDLLSEWDEIVLPYKCGLLSSFSLESHAFGKETIERRLQLDIYDSHSASKKHDRLLVRQAVSAIVTNRLQYGSLPIN